MNSNNKNSENLKKYLPRMVLIAFIAIIIVLVLYFSNFNHSLSDKQSDFGTFGDFVGGTLNPIFGFLSFIAILYTIFIQTKELEYTRDELRANRDEFKNQTEAFKINNALQIISRNYTRLNELESSLVYIHGIGSHKETKNDYKNLISDIKGGKSIQAPYTSVEALVTHIQWMEDYIEQIELEDIKQLMKTELDNHKQSFYIEKVEPILYFLFYKEHIEKLNSYGLTIQFLEHLLTNNQSDMDNKLAGYLKNYFSDNETDFDAIINKKMSSHFYITHGLKYNDFLEIVAINEGLIWEK